MTNKYRKNKIIVFVGLISLVLISFTYFMFVDAATEGQIDPANKYARGVDNASVSINMGMFKGSIGISVTDSGVKGFAWGDGIGWVNFYPNGGGVLNDGKGNITGYATTEFGGRLDFESSGSSTLTITPSGDFVGYATSEKFGKIYFNCATHDSCVSRSYKVRTNWRPKEIRDAPGFLEEFFTDTSADSPIASAPSMVNTTTPVKEIFIGEKPVAPPRAVSATDSRNKDSSDVKETANDFPLISIPKGDLQVVAVSEGGIKTLSFFGMLALIPVFVDNFLGLENYHYNIFKIVILLFAFLGLKRKMKAWGTVYDSNTKQPLDPVYVVLSDKSGREVSTAITDMDGRFGFLVPSGWYRISVNKNNYVFPSEKLKGKNTDGFYQNIYFGEDVYLDADDANSMNIPMDSKGFDWNEDQKKSKNLFKFNSGFSSAMYMLSMFLFNFGFVLSLVINIFYGFSVYNILILVSFVAVWVTRKMRVKRKTNGIISESDTGFPLSFAKVRILSKDNQKEIFHRIADKYGNYYCLLPKGEYYVKIDKKNNDDTYTNVYTSELLNLKNGILNKDFVV
jgi:hypothetical protein